MNNETNATEIFAKRLKELRLCKDLSLKKLASDLGVTAQSLSLYETGQRAINIDLLKRIAEYFSVSSDYLLGLSDAATNDADLKAVCDYTGLSEDAVRALNFTVDSLSQPEALDLGESEHVTKLLKTLSWLISGRHIYKIIYHLLLINDYSEYYLIGYKHKHMRSNELDYLLDLQEREKDIDFERYQLNKYIEKLSNYFDQREQVQNNGKHNPSDE